MLKQEYNRMNEKIQPDAALRGAVLDQAVPRHRHHLRPAIAAALVVLLLTAVPVMAANNPQVLDWLCRVSPSLASVLIPVDESSTANGIQVEVLGVSASDGKAQLLLCFRKADGTPVDVYPTLENVYFDVYHSWRHERSYPYTLTESDEKVLLLEMSCRNGTAEEFYGTKTTVLIDVISLPETKVYEAPLVLTDSEIIAIPADFTMEEAVLENFWSFGVGANNGYHEIDDWEEYRLIAPAAGSVHDVTDQVAVTGICYIDDRLHIQICQSVPYEDAAFFAWLEDAAGNRVYEYAFHDFGMTKDGQEFRGTEHYFDIPREELANYRLMVEVTEKNRTEGPWEVSFVLSESDPAGEAEE